MIELNRIYNEDCFEAVKNIGDKTVDHTFTSPPYNRKRNDKYQHYEDVIDDYYAFLCKITDELLRVTKNYTFINLQKNYYNKREFFEYLGAYADRIVEMIVWEKSNPLPASALNITNAYEVFVVLSHKPLKGNTTYTKNHITTSVNSQMAKEHKAVMKYEVAEWFISNFTKENETVLDPFMGVGTTAVACINTNRSYIGFELSKEYCDLANERIAKAVRPE